MEHCLLVPKLIFSTFCLHNRHTDYLVAHLNADDFTFSETVFVDMNTIITPDTKHDIFVSQTALSDAAKGLTGYSPTPFSLSK